MLSKLTRYIFSIIFFFNDTATTEIYTLSLHDALPTCESRAFIGGRSSRIVPTASETSSRTNSPTLPPAAPGPTWPIAAEPTARSGPDVDDLQPARLPAA